MEDWLAGYKDTCTYNLGESGMPDITVGELLGRCGEIPDALLKIMLKDNDTRGTERLRQAICASYGGNIPLENITVTTGTSEALFILFNLLLEDKASAVVPMPSFQALSEIPKALGAKMRCYRVLPENGYIPDPDEVNSLIDGTTGVVVLNTPHNPSGVIIPDDVSETIISKASCHGAAVISDEHYRFLPHDRNWPLISLAQPDGNVIAAGSITKCFGLIGLRMGWIAGPEALITKVRDFRDYLTHTLSPASDFLAAIALENAEVFLEPNIRILRKNTEELISLINKTPGLSLVTPQAGAVAFPGYEYEVSTDEFVRGLIDRHGVFVLPGSSFEVKGHFRINLGQNPGLFKNALDCIHDYCNSF